jgi:hypothetical protein
LVLPAENPPSQYLRAAIGKELGHAEPEFWDWRRRDDARDRARVKATLRRLKEPFSKVELGKYAL